MVNAAGLGCKIRCLFVFVTVIVFVSVLLFVFVFVFVIVFVLAMRNINGKTRRVSVARSDAYLILHPV